MKKIFTCIFCAVLAISCWGETNPIQIGEITNSKSENIPIGCTSGSYNSITQLLYLASELTTAGATAGDIESISFYYCGSTEKTRTIDVWINSVTNSSFTSYWFYYISDNPKNYKPGTLYAENASANLTANGGWYTITFDNAYKWDGTSNIIITINDKSNARITTESRYHKTYTATANRANYASKGSGTPYDATNCRDISGTRTTAMPIIQFNFSAGTPTPTYDAPTNVSATTTSSTATISWTKKDEAKIKLQYSPKGADNWTTIENIDAASYTITGLSAETEYEYKVSAVYEGGESEEVEGSFTTASVGHEHDGIAFLGWGETTALPIQAGSYFLKNDVTVTKWTLPSGNTKICLNGKTITITGITNSSITIDNGTNLSIYDNEGDGKITAGLNFAATIKVNAGGTLSLYGGTIENTATAESASAVHVASNTGTFNLKGDVKMSTSNNAADINLQYGKITLVGALTNTTKLSVSKTANQDITSGWSTYMGSASPAGFFTSANKEAPAVILVDGEAQLGMPSFEFSETGKYTTYPSGVTNVNLVRTFQSGILNTISLPFDLTDAQMKKAFGEDYELYQLSSSALSNDVLEVYFDKVSSLTLGYPYLLKVSENVVDPSFSSVTLNTASHRVQTDAIDMVSVVQAQDVTGSDYNLFLNAAGELNWSTKTALFKGMRAYFQVKENYRNAVAARQLIIRNTPTGMKSIATPQMVEKTFEKGHLFILKNGKKYTMQGQIIK